MKRRQVESKRSSKNVYKGCIAKISSIRNIPSLPNFNKLVFVNHSSFHAAARVVSVVWKLDKYPASYEMVLNIKLYTARKIYQNFNEFIKLIKTHQNLNSCGISTCSTVKLSCYSGLTARTCKIVTMKYA